jgi:hypothetical protein
MDRMAKKLGEMRKGPSSLLGGDSPRYSVQKVDRKAKRSKNGLIYTTPKRPKRAQSGVRRTPRGGESRINTGLSSVWISPLFGIQRGPSW